MSPALAATAPAGPGLRRRWAALLLATALPWASCSVNRDPHEETPEPDLVDGMFNEPPAPEPPMGGCTPSVDELVYFDGAVVEALGQLTCSRAGCHADSVPALVLSPDDVSKSYMEALKELTSCDEAAKLVTWPATDTLHKGLNLTSKPEFQTLIDWVLSCAPLSADDPGQGCGGGSGTDGGPADMPAPVDTAVTPDAPPPADMTAADAPPACLTTGLTYMANIDRIVTGMADPSYSCTFCHAVSTPHLVEGNPAANYAALGGSSALVARGYLYPSDHFPGPIVPAGSCEDQQVRAWIQDLAPQ